MNKEIIALIEKAIKIKEPHAITGRPNYTLDTLELIRATVSDEDYKKAAKLAEELHSEVEADTYFADVSGYYLLSLADTLKKLTETIKQKTG